MLIDGPAGTFAAAACRTHGVLRFLGTIAAIVALVWGLSLLASGDLAELDGRNAAPIELPAFEPVTRIVDPEAEDDPPLGKTEPEQPKDERKNAPKGGKRPRPLTSGLFAS